MQTAKRHVDKTDIGAGIWVSTVFLGLDHSFFDDEPPLLFETMVFGADPDPDRAYADVYQERCSTWDEAVEMHKRAVYWALERYAPTDVMKLLKDTLTKGASDERAANPRQAGSDS